MRTDAAAAAATWSSINTEASGERGEAWRLRLTDCGQRVGAAITQSVSRDERLASKQKISTVSVKAGTQRPPPSTLVIADSRLFTPDTCSPRSGLCLVLH